MKIRFSTVITLILLVSLFGVLLQQIEEASRIQQNTFRALQAESNDLGEQEIKP